MMEKVIHIQQVVFHNRVNCIAFSDIFLWMSTAWW